MVVIATHIATHIQLKTKTKLDNLASRYWNSVRYIIAMIVHNYNNNKV